MTNNFKEQPIDNACWLSFSQCGKIEQNCFLRQCGKDKEAEFSLSSSEDNNLTTKCFLHLGLGYDGRREIGDDMWPQKCSKLLYASGKISNIGPNNKFYVTRVFKSSTISFYVRFLLLNILYYYYS